MLKRFLLLSMLFFLAGYSFAQTDTIPGRIKTLFEGKWIIKSRYYTNTVEIKFEPGSSYATFIDIGTGEAPPVALHAFVQGDTLVIPAKQHVNDYIELTVAQGRLVFRTQPAIEEEDGTIRKPDKAYLVSKKFRRIKKK